MRKIGFITAFVLVVIAIFLWSARNVVDHINHNVDSSIQYGIGGGPGEASDSSLGQTSLDENASLDALFQEHAILGAFHLQDLYDGKDTSETTGKLQINSINIANFFEKNLGIEKYSFLSMWDAHIREYENYTRALKAGDRNGTAAARSELNTQAMMMGEMIEKVYPGIPASEVARLMNEHIDLTLSVIEAYAAGDSATKLSQSSKAAAQAVAFANAIVEAVNHTPSPNPNSTP